MKPYFTIFGRTVPLYGVCFLVGILCAGIVGSLICKKRNVKRYDFVYASVFALIGGLVGAKLLFVIVTLPSLIENQIPITSLLYGGFVFYGGAIGGGIGLYIYLCVFRLEKTPAFDLFAVLVPLGHAFGRIGCFISGCCYGIEADGWLSYTYSEALGADTPIGIPLLPVQLIESGFLFLLFGCLLLLYLRKNYRPGQPLLLYCLTYPVARFILEFFRGDKERGLFLSLSTSQWISIAILFGSVVTALVLQKPRAKNV